MVARKVPRPVEETEGDSSIPRSVARRVRPSLSPSPAHTCALSAPSSAIATTNKTVPACFIACLLSAGSGVVFDAASLIFREPPDRYGKSPLSIPRALDTDRFFLRYTPDTLRPDSDRRAWRTPGRPYGSPGGGCRTYRADTHQSEGATLHAAGRGDLLPPRFAAHSPGQASHDHAGRGRPRRRAARPLARARAGVLHPRGDRHHDRRDRDPGGRPGRLCLRSLGDAARDPQRNPKCIEILQRRRARLRNERAPGAVAPGQRERRHRRGRPLSTRRRGQDRRGPYLRVRLSDAVMTFLPSLNSSHADWMWSSSLKMIVAWCMWSSFSLFMLVPPAHLKTSVSPVCFSAFMRGWLPVTQ